MRRAQAFVAYLAVCCLTHATVAPASDDSSFTDLADSSGTGNIAQQDATPELGSVPIELSQMATPVDKGALLANDPSGPAAAIGTGSAAADAASAATTAADFAPVRAEPASLDVPAATFAGEQSDAALISSAPPADDAIFATGGIQRVSDDELSEQRGGFVYQGVDISFGAEIRSYIGNELVMQTNFNWTDPQANVEHMVSTELTPAALADVQAGMLNGAGLSMRIGNDNIYVANGGQTAFVQRADGTLQNIIVNSASNVTLRQEIDANLNLSNFAPFQNAAVTGQIISALSNVASAALTMGSTR